MDVCEDFEMKLSLKPKNESWILLYLIIINEKKYNFNWSW